MTQRSQRSQSDRLENKRSQSDRLRSQGDQLEERVRRRVAEVLSAAGMPDRTVGAGVLYLLPHDFVREYEAIYSRALSTEDGTNRAGSGVGNAEAKIGKARLVRGRGGAKSPGNLGGRKGHVDRIHKGAWRVQNEEMFELKGRVDQKLRALTREMRGLREAMEISMAGESGKGGKGGDGGRGRSDLLGLTGGRCSRKGCGKYLEKSWRFCPFCGEVTYGHGES